MASAAAAAELTASTQYLPRTTHSDSARTASSTLLLHHTPRVVAFHLQLDLTFGFGIGFVPLSSLLAHIKDQGYPERLIPFFPRHLRLCSTYPLRLHSLLNLLLFTSLRSGIIIYPHYHHEASSVQRPALSPIPLIFKTSSVHHFKFQISPVFSFFDFFAFLTCLLAFVCLFASFDTCPLIANLFCIFLCAPSCDSVPQATCPIPPRPYVEGFGTRRAVFSSSPFLCPFLPPSSAAVVKICPFFLSREAHMCTARVRGYRPSCWVVVHLLG